MTKWFGEPWPAADRRAPVCSDDRDKVPTPVGSTCQGCFRMIAASDQGVIIPHLGEDEVLGRSAFHIKCLLRTVLGVVADDLGV